MHICVLGAGIAGLATAYALQRRGHEVTVVDQAAHAGAGASGGNGAQLSYAYVQPLADPGLWRQLPRLLLAADSPLKLRPALDAQQWAWLLAFLAACRESTSTETTRQLLALAAASRAGFDAMRADLAPSCDFSATGKLVLYRTDSGLDAARRQLQLQRSFGSEQRVVDASEAVALEPALARDASPFAGAVFTPGECAADCLRVCEALATALQARGARLLYSTRVLAPRGTRGGALAALQTSEGDIAADAFVCALGTASTAFASHFGQRLQLYPLKGYSMTLDIAGLATDAAPRVNVTDSARKVVFARLGSRLRVAGIAEIAGHDMSIPQSRIESLRAATQSLFPGCSAAPQVQHWTGMRPATPTGRPILGPLEGLPRNVLFNTGHGALGFTLAFGTAARISALVETQQA